MDGVASSRRVLVKDALEANRERMGELRKVRRVVCVQGVVCPDRPCRDRWRGAQ